MLLRKYHALAMAVLLAVLAGCSTTPIGKRDLLDFLQDGKTTREDVFLRLAEPSATFESGRILTYRMDEDEGGYTIKGAKGVKWSAKYSLVLSFDEKGILRRHALVRVQEVYTP
jgi:hypothetical protein